MQGDTKGGYRGKWKGLVRLQSGEERGAVPFRSALIVASIAFACSVAYASDCADYGAGPVAPLGTVDTPSLADRVEVAGGFAYVADWYSGLQVVDVSDPTTPRIVGSLSTGTGEPTLDLAIWDHYVLLQGVGNGFLVVDVSHPETPSVLTKVTTGWVTFTTVAGGYAYVSLFDTAVEIYDVAVPEAPVLISTIQTPDFHAREVEVVGDRAYVVWGDSWWGGLMIVDIADPAAPATLGAVAMPDYAEDVEVQGDFAYVASFGVQVVDISNPRAPAIVGSYPSTGDVGLAVDGRFAYCTSAEGVVVLDVGTLPPTLVGAMPTDFDRNPLVRGNRLYVTGGDAGLAIFPVQCDSPTAVEMTFFEAAASLTDVELSWGTGSDANLLGFWLSRSADGGSFQRLHAPLIERSPEPGGTYVYRDATVEPGGRYSYRLEAVTRGEDLICLGERTLSLPLAMVQPPFRFACHPNPLVETTSVDFSLGSPTRVVLGVYDVGGRLVRRLFDEPLGPGTHAIAWDRRDASARRVGAGLYILRAETGARSVTAKLVVVN